MSNYKIEFTLRQHTPLIHFLQHKSTLRGTEVKPKLDKFIIQKMKGWENVPDAWKVDPGSTDIKALKYKIRIEPLGIINYQDAGKLPNYFAEMENDKNREAKKTSVTDNLKVSIFAYDNSLKNEIEKHISSFWATHNFGTRQNKGFGCFYIHEDDRLFSPVQQILPNSFQIHVPSQSNNCIWSVIKYYYQRLKSGLNHRQLDVKYREPFLRDYVNAQWEKKWLKHHFLGLPEAPSPDVAFWRLLLGMPYEFRFIESEERNNPLKPRGWNVPDEILVKVSHTTIKRFKSPVTFKVYKHADGANTTIYVVLSDYSSEFTELLAKEPEFTFHPSFGLRTGVRKDREGNTLFDERTDKVKFNKLRYISSDYSKSSGGEKADMDKSISFAKRLESENKNDRRFERINGQYNRLQHFLATQPSQELPAPLPPPDFLKSLFTAYHQHLRKEPINVLWKENEYDKNLNSIRITVNQMP